MNQHEEWKKSGVHHKVRVVASGGQTALGDVYIQNWSRNERMSRSLKALGGCAGGAVVSVFIPLLHFVLVPGFLIAAPVLAWKIYQQDSVVLGGMTTCPKCGAPMPIVRGKVNWPLKDVCAKCYENVKIEDQKPV